MANHIIARCWGCREAAGSNPNCPVCTRLAPALGLQASLDRVRRLAEQKPQWRKTSRKRLRPRANAKAIVPVAGTQDNPAHSQLPPSDR